MISAGTLAVALVFLAWALAQSALARRKLGDTELAFRHHLTTELEASRLPPRPWLCTISGNGPGPAGR